MFMWKKSAMIATPSPDLLGERHALIQPVDGVLFVAVERFEEDRNAGVAGRWRELLALFNEQFSFELGPGLVRG
jgi:hypothetical protein